MKPALAILLVLAPQVVWGQTFDHGILSDDGWNNGSVHCGPSSFPCPPVDQFSKQQTLKLVCPDGYTRALVEQPATVGQTTGTPYPRTQVPKCARTDAIIEGTWK